MRSISDLLSPFLSRPLHSDQVAQLQLYLDLLLKWNAKINLTAVRDPDEIVRRHFGESLFAGAQLLLEPAHTLADLGSGAGFPGLPIKILAPQLKVTLIESQQKKVAFLRDVVRTLGLDDVIVHAGRAEEAQLKSQIVTMRAVEKFADALPVAASLIAPRGRLALLIGRAQSSTATRLLPQFQWAEALGIPGSCERIVLTGCLTG